MVIPVIDLYSYVPWSRTIQTVPFPENSPLSVLLTTASCWCPGQGALYRAELGRAWDVRGLVHLCWVSANPNLNPKGSHLVPWCPTDTLGIVIARVLLLQMQMGLIRTAQNFSYFLVPRALGEPWASLQHVHPQECLASQLCHPGSLHTGYCHLLCCPGACAVFFNLF